MPYNIDNVILFPTVPMTGVATGTLTSDNTNVSDGDTVTIDSVTYRFKTTPVQLYDVAIGASADASLTNLADCINEAGNPNTEYFNSTPAHPTVSSGAVSSHAIVITAKNAGYAGNNIVSTETSSHLSFGATTLTGGVGGKINNVVLSGAQTITTDPLLVGPYHELMMFLNVTAHSGTNPTLDCKMQYINDDAYDASMDSGDAFTQVTTTNSLTNKKATAGFGKWVRFVLTIAGTNPSYTTTFTVAAKN